MQEGAGTSAPRSLLKDNQAAMLAKQLCGRQGRGRPGVGRVRGVGGGKLIPELGAGRPRKPAAAGWESPRPAHQHSGGPSARGGERLTEGAPGSAESPVVLLEKRWVCSRFPARFNSISRMGLTLLNVSYICDPGKPRGLKKPHPRPFLFQKRPLQFTAILPHMT